MANERFTQELAALIDRHYVEKENPKVPTLQARKVEAVKSAMQVHEKNTNTLADVIAAMAPLVKVPHNLSQIGIEAILNDTEPESEKDDLQEKADAEQANP